MRSGSLGVWLGKRREKEVLGQCGDHLAKIIETVKQMSRGVAAYERGDLDVAKSFAEAASQREKEADEIKRAILTDLVKGMFHPIDRDEILRFVLEADGIASNAKAAVRKLTMIPRDDVSDSLSAELSRLGEKLVDTVEAMRDAFNALINGSEEVFELAQKVESFEEEIDEFRVHLIQNHFLPWCTGEERTGFCIILKEAMDNMENVADQAEDVADVMRSIAILSK